MTSSTTSGRPALPAGWSVRTITAAPPPAALDAVLLPPAESLPVPPGRVLVVVNDAQRSTPTPWLIGRLAIDWTREDIDFAVATGSHRPPGEAELAAIFGPYRKRVEGRLILHDHRDASLHLGTTAAGTPVAVNPCLSRRNAVICLGSVEPHYFAGWTGGRKSIVPGLSSLETMRRNHRLALQGGLPGVPGRCPVAQDLDEALGLVSSRLGAKHGTRLLGLNVVFHDGTIHGCHWGDLDAALRALDRPARLVYGREAGGTAGIVLARVEPPLDRDLYQSLKAFENWKGAVAPGGTLILLSPCTEGIGPPTFVQFLGSPPPLPTLRAATAETYRLGDHKLANFLSYRASGRRLFIVPQSPLGTAVPALDFFPDLDSALARAQGDAGRENVVLLDVYDAASTYPVDLPAECFL